MESSTEKELVNMTEKEGLDLTAEEKSSLLVRIQKVEDARLTFALMNDAFNLYLMTVGKKHGISGPFRLSQDLTKLELIAPTPDAAAVPIPAVKEGKKK